jgi:hypothetical protein
MQRVRSVLSTVLLVLSGVLIPIGAIAAWADSTVYDSARFSRRAVQLLDSSSVRRELAGRLTEQLARAGNEQAIAFRPAAILAIEAVIDTDTFRSIFRSAIEQTHVGLVEGLGGTAGLDLSDSFALVSASLEAGSAGQSTEAGSGSGLGRSMADITRRADQLHFWELGDAIDLAAIVGTIGGIILAAAAIALSRDRRRTVARVGWMLVIDGLVIVALLKGLRVYAGRRIDSPELADAVQGALARATADLNAAGFWIAGYGIVTAAAAGALGGTATRLTPTVVRSKVSVWIERRRATSGGTVLLGVLGLFIGLVFIQEPLGNLEALIVAGGLWLSYLAITELVGLIGSGAAGPQAHGRSVHRTRHLVIAGCGAVLVGLVTIGLVVSTRQASDKAEALGVPQCNGAKERCDLRLDQVVFPGSHNSMSSALYPGWLFGEQVNTIKTQLDAGVRALLIDTHYGVPSSARLPGAGTPLVITDRVSGPVAPQGEELDPEVIARANELAARAPRAANAKRAIYLCHNYCELGAVSFASVLADVKDFLDTHPDEVVILDIQDATTPADTAAAIEQAGLGDRVASLQPGEPLPTLGELIDAGTTLLVFAEVGGPGGPDWYHQMYEWFQETPFTYPSVDAFDCRPNRGPAAAPMLLINHWVSKKGLADPAAASQANHREVLEERMERCIRERGLFPTIVAVDFASRGDLVDTAGEHAQQLRSLLGGAGAPSGSSTTVAGTATTTTASPAATAPPVESGPPLTATPITKLTGGDPTGFCAVLPDTRRTIYAWALGASTEPDDAAGQHDLAFGPLLARQLPALIASAPTELAERAQPVLDRAEAAVAALEALGVDEEAAAELAEQTDQALDAVTGLDTTAVEQEVLAAASEAVGGDRFPSGAAQFAAANPQTPDLFDLGEVPESVGVPAGYACLYAPAGSVDVSGPVTAADPPTDTVQGS